MRTTRIRTKRRRKRPGAAARTQKRAALKRAAPPAPEAEAGESLTEEIRRKTDGLLTDEEIELVRQEVEAGRFDAEAAAALRKVLLRRDAKRNAQ